MTDLTRSNQQRNNICADKMYLFVRLMLHGIQFKSFREKIHNVFPLEQLRLFQGLLFIVNKIERTQICVGGRGWLAAVLSGSLRSCTRPASQPCGLLPSSSFLNTFLRSAQFNLKISIFDFRRNQKQRVQRD